MTRKEFIQQAVISMAAKVIGQNGITDSYDWEHMVDEADDLANIVEEHGYGFDEE